MLELLLKRMKDNDVDEFDELEIILIDRSMNMNVHLADHEELLEQVPQPTIVKQPTRRKTIEIPDKVPQEKSTSSFHGDSSSLDDA